jgi:hypothetical protein
MSRQTSHILCAEGGLNGCVELKMTIKPGSPLLIGILVDVSASMRSTIANNRGASMRRLDAFGEALERVVADAASSIRKITGTATSPDVKLFAYGFGFGNLATVFGDFLLGRKAPKVRDLLAEGGNGEKTVDILELNDNWKSYENNVQAMAPDMLGETPMREALELAKVRIIKECGISSRGTILFILSDGLPTGNTPDDGPQGILKLANDIRAEGTIVVSCFVTDADLITPRRLYGAYQASWPEAAKLMFDAASLLSADSTFERHLREYGWDIDSGAKLFTQVNHSETLEEFMKVVSSLISDTAARGLPQDDIEQATDVERQIMKNDDRLRIADLLAVQALNEDGYFRRLIQQADLTREFKLQRQSGWSGKPKSDALDLVDWALDKGRNPANPRYTTLASVLMPELTNLGFDDAALVVAIISAYKLILDPDLMDNLRQKFQVPAYQPIAIGAREQAGSLLGPEIDWHGPRDAMELQSWLPPAVPDFLDIGFLRDAIRTARAVCLVNVGATRASGTGVLVGRRFVLTNYHVLVPEGAASEPRTHAASVRLRFGVFSGSGEATEIGLDPDDPVPVSSEIDKLDFVLLRLSPEFNTEPKAHLAKIGRATPAPKSSINILQHPHGGSMQLALSTDAVTFIDPAGSIIQYVTRTASGSSGAPCFDPEWRLVAIHHAERSRAFGTIREGILIDPIMKQMEACLPSRDLDLT